MALLVWALGLLAGGAMRALLKVWLIMAFAVASALPVGAASVIFFSKADTAYGWCAGYSYGRGESCAREQCMKYGSACELAVECDGGWSAAAMAYDPIDGFGASCQFESAAIARAIALVSCIYASHALCYTSDAFNGNASSASDKANEAFDIAWYTQDMLLRLGYDLGPADGVIGAKTRTAIRQVQTQAGLEATGETDWDFIYVLLVLGGGSERLTQAIIGETDSFDQAVVRNYSYRYSAKPATQSLGREIAGWSDPLRLKALAALLHYNDYACTVPARQAVQDPNNADGWVITCDQGDFAMVATSTQTIITVGDKIVTTDCPATDDTATDDTTTDDSDTMQPGRVSNGRSERQGGNDAIPTASVEDDTEVKPAPTYVGGTNPAFEAQGSGGDTLTPCPSGQTAPASEDDTKPADVYVGAPPPTSDTKN
jgi:hypothetical protein